MNNDVSIKNCPYCSGELFEYSNFCPACKARIPEWFSNEENDSKEVNSEQEIAIPKPGDMIGSLTLAIEKVLSGEVPAEKLLQALPGIKTELTNIFVKIEEDLASIQEEGDGIEYKNFILGIMGNISRFFDLSLAEMELMQHDGDSSHLTFGIFLLQRAEIDYIELLKSIKMQSKMDIFANETSVLGTLASRLQTGEETVASYKETLEKLKESIKERIKNSSENIDKALEQALNYTGSNDETIKKAILKASEGAQELSTVILNLYNPEESKKVLESTIRETVKDLKESGELSI